MKGFEPLRRFTDLMVFKTILFNQLEYTSEIKKVSYICHRAINANLKDVRADSHCFSLSQSPFGCFTNHNDLNHVFATTRSFNCQFSMPVEFSGFFIT